MIFLTTEGKGMKHLPVTPTARLTISLVAVLLCVGIGSVRAGDGAPTLEDLKNLTYRGIYEHPVQLKDGLFEGVPFVPGGASRPRVRLVEQLMVTSDLNGDGGKDTAVLLTESSGGSGENLYLAVATTRDEEVENIATQPIGDRVGVRSLKADNGALVLDLIVAGPQDAACCPTLKVRTTYRLEGDRLLETVREALGPLTFADLAGVTWNLKELGWHQPVPKVIEISAEFEADRISGNGGCNRYFAGLKGSGPYGISVAPPGATRRACPEPQMEWEKRYLSALENVTQIRFLLGKLVLTYQMENGPSNSLVFAADQ